MKYPTIAPSILSADFCNLEKAIQQAERGGSRYLHIDVMDGHFVPNITVGMPVVKAIRARTSQTLDVHLMIEHPDRYLEAFAEAGADIITVHQEACRHLHRTLNYIRGLGKKAGVSLNPSTPICALEEVWECVDLVLVMSVNPGFPKQRFIPQTFSKIARLKEIKTNHGYPFLIEVDGGVQPGNIIEIARAGAEILVAGSAVYDAGHPPEEALREMLSLLYMECINRVDADAVDSIKKQ